MENAYEYHLHRFCSFCFVCGLVSILQTEHTFKKILINKVQITCSWLWFFKLTSRSRVNNVIYQRTKHHVLCFLTIFFYRLTILFLGMSIDCRVESWLIVICFYRLTGQLFQNTHFLQKKKYYFLKLINNTESTMGIFCLCINQNKNMKIATHNYSKY